MEKYRVGVIGGTGMVGQRFVTLLENHPCFELTAIAASARSAGKTYEEAIGARWALDVPMPEAAKGMVVYNAETDIEEIAARVKLARDGLADARRRTKLARGEAVRIEAAAESATDEQRGLVSRLVTSRDALASAEREKRSTLASIQSDRSDVLAEIEDLEAQSEALAARIRAAQQQSSSSSAPSSSTGRRRSPTPCSRSSHSSSWCCSAATAARPSASPRAATCSRSRMRCSRQGRRASSSCCCWPR